MVKRLGVAVVVAFALAVTLASTALADDEQDLKVEFAVLTDDYEWHGSYGVKVTNVINPRNGSVQYYTMVQNFGNAPAKSPVATEHEWSTGTLSYMNSWTYGSRQPSPGRWDMTTLGLDRFRLVYTPPEGGLLPGEYSSLVVNYLTKCEGDFAYIVGKTSDGQSQRFNIGLPDVYAGASAFWLSGVVAYNNGEVPAAGEVIVTTRCHAEVARLPLQGGWFASRGPLMAEGADYYLAFRPSAEEVQTRGLRWQGWGFGEPIRPTSTSPEVIVTLGTVPLR